MKAHFLAVWLEATMTLAVERSRTSIEARRAVFHDKTLCLGSIDDLWNVLIRTAENVFTALNAADEESLEIQTGMLHGMLHVLRLRQPRILGSVQDAWLAVEPMVLRLQTKYGLPAFEDRRSEATGRQGR